MVPTPADSSEGIKEPTEQPTVQDKLHGVGYNLELFNNQNLLHAHREAAEDILARSPQKVKKILKREIDALTKNPLGSHACFQLSHSSAPLFYTEGIQLTSDGKRGNFITFVIDVILISLFPW